MQRVGVVSSSTFYSTCTHCSVPLREMFERNELSDPKPVKAVVRSFDHNATEKSMYSALETYFNAVLEDAGTNDVYTVRNTSQFVAKHSTCSVLTT